MRFLNFIIKDEEYGVPLEQVREVIAFPAFTPIPNSREYILGIMNLREEIIPIFDLRIRLKIEPTLTHDTSVIICCLNNFSYGIVVDSIQTVISPPDSEVLNIPNAQEGNGATDMVPQVVRSKEKSLILILDMGRLIDATDPSLATFFQTQKELRKAA